MHLHCGVTINQNRCFLAICVESQSTYLFDNRLINKYRRGDKTDNLRVHSQSRHQSREFTVGSKERDAPPAIKVSNVCRSAMRCAAVPPEVAGYVSVWVRTNRLLNEGSRSPVTSISLELRCSHAEGEQRVPVWVNTGLREQRVAGTSCRPCAGRTAMSGLISQHDGRNLAERQTGGNKKASRWFR